MPSRRVVEITRELRSCRQYMTAAVMYLHFVARKFRRGVYHAPIGLSIPSHLTMIERIALAFFSSERKGLHVEIGSYLGASACAISAGLMASNGCDRLVCIDTWANDAMTEGSRDTYEEFRKNTQRHADRITVLRKWSQDAIDDLRREQGSIAFWFHDGDHSYEAVGRDWDLYSPLLSERALVLFHDYGWAEGVKKVVNERVRPSCEETGRIGNLFWGCRR